MYELVCILATIVVYIHSRMYLQLYAYYVRIVNYVLDVTSRHYYSSMHTSSTREYIRNPGAGRCRAKIIVTQ